MKKYQFKLDKTLIDKASKPIRNKLDLIKLLLYSIKLVLTEGVNNIDLQSNEKLIIYVDKMSRIVFCVENKIFSFQFPFTIKPQEQEPLCVSISHAPFFQIDSISSSLLLAVFNRIDIFDGGLDTIYTKVLEEIVENEWIDIDVDLFCELIKHLMLFEPGYLRYDHDIEHENGRLHPEHHIDFYFTTNNAIKLGLDREIHDDWLLDMLDILTDCKYIK